MGLKRLVSTAFKTYPMLCNSAIFGTLHIAAEFSQQTFLKTILLEPNTPEPPYDLAVLRNYGIVGGCAMAPTMFYWYRWLDQKYPGKTVKIVVKKVLMDQMLMTPIILSIFFVGMSILEWKDESIFKQAQDKLFPTFQASCAFWFPAQALNFGFISPQYRVVYMAFCALGWTNILCYYKRDATTPVL